MKKLIPNHSITLFREGKFVTPDIGKPFSFTADEIKDITKANPQALREPVNEDPEPAETSTESSETDKTPVAAKTAAKGKSKSDEAL